jgi:hypothetical protein
MGRACRRSARGVLAAAICLGSVAATAGAASAQAALDVGDAATLLADGAAVGVPVTVTCDPLPAPLPGTLAPSQHIDVAVFEVVGHHIAFGLGDEQIFTCDGTPQDVTVFVTPAPMAAVFAKPFGEGDAFAAASLETCVGASLPGPVPLPAPPVCQRTEAYNVISIAAGS